MVGSLGNLPMTSIRNLSTKGCHQNVQEVSSQEVSVPVLQTRIEELLQEVSSLSTQLESSKCDGRRHVEQIKDRAASKVRGLWSLAFHPQAGSPFILAHISLSFVTTG